MAITILRQIKSLNGPVTNDITVATGDAPGIHQDSAHRYAKGSIWLNLTNGLGYFCTSPTKDAATWASFAASAPAEPQTLEVVTTQLDKAEDTTLATPVGLTAVTLAAGATYVIRAHLYTISTTSGGLKLAFTAAGGLTATSFIATTQYANGATPGTYARATALGALAGVTAEVVTDVEIVATIKVNAAGTLALQAAQNASHVDTTSVKVGSYLEVTKVS